MQKFKTKTTLVEAVRFDPFLHPKELRFETDEGVVIFPVMVNPNDLSALRLEVKGNIAMSYCLPGDWMVKNERGVFHPWKDDVFRACYEPI